MLEKKQIQEIKNKLKIAKLLLFRSISSICLKRFQHVCVKCLVWFMFVIKMCFKLINVFVSYSFVCATFVRCSWIDPPGPQTYSSDGRPARAIRNAVTNFPIKSTQDDIHHNHCTPTPHWTSGTIFRFLYFWRFYDRKPKYCTRSSWV